MKHYAAAIVGVLLLAVVAAVLVGGHAGLLSTTGSQPPTLTQVSSGAGGLTFSVGIIDQPIVSSFFPSGNTTSFTVQLQAWVGNTTCDQAPGFSWGSGADSGFVEVQFLDPNTGAAINIPNVGTAWFSNQNGTSPTAAAFCYGKGVNGGGPVVWQHTFSFQGQFPDYTVVKASFSGEGRYCDGNAFQTSESACNLNGAGSGIAGLNAWGTSPGGFLIQPYGEAYVRNGQASLSLESNGPYYNGGTFTATVTTGFDFGQGFNLEFLTPAVRPQGGQPVNGTNAVVNIPDNTLGKGVTFAIPAGASQNNSNPLWNAFQLVLVQVHFVEESQPILIDISAAFAPTQPILSFTDITSTTGAINPGDTITVSMSANAPHNGSAVTGFLVWAYYLLPGGSSQNGFPPATSPAWISTNGPQGQVIPANVAGTNSTSIFTFTAGQVASVFIQAAAITSSAQYSPKSSVTLSVVPAGCHDEPACPSGNNPTSELGPILLAIIILLLFLLAAILIPVPALTPPVKYLIFIAVGIGLVLLLWFTGLLAVPFGG